MVENIYSNEQVAYIRIGYEFNVSADIEYKSGEKNGYSLGVGKHQLYTNKNARFYVWAILSDCTISAKLNGSSFTPSVTEQESGFYIDLTGAGEYSIIIKDATQNEIEISLSIKAPENIQYNNYLDGFNGDALYRDRYYTNAPLNVVKELIDKNGIGRIRYVFSQNGIDKIERVIYDKISEKKIDLAADAFKGCIGKDGNGTYTVYFMDMYGNEVERTVYISNKEQLTIGRLTQLDAEEQAYSLKDAIERGAWSNRTIILNNSAAASVLKVNGEVVAFTDGKYKFDFPVNVGQGHEKYQIEYLDEYGNKYSFVVNLYRKVPEVSLLEGTTVLEDNGSVYVKGEFGYTWSDPNITATYTLQGGGEEEYVKGSKLLSEGAYVFTFTDLAGNVTVRKMNYDASVSYRLSSDDGEVNSGIATNGAISIRRDGEEIKIISVKRDGVEIENDSMTFDEHGYYEVTLEDRIGNQTVVKFYIIGHAFKDFTYVADEGYAITDVWFTVDGFKLSYVGDVTIGADGKQSYSLKDVGTYELVITELATSKTHRFSVTIDRTPPAATLVGVEDGGRTREPVTLSGVEIGDLVEVYRNGELVFSKRATSEVVDPPYIESSGDFRVVITDEAGNSVEYTFHKEFATNLASNIILLIMMLIAVAGAMLYLYLGKKVKVK